MALEPFKRSLIELFGRQPFALDQGEEVPDQIGHVLDALAQRWHAQRHDVEREEQILTEQPLLDQNP